MYNRIMNIPGHKTTKQAAEIIGIRVDSLRRAAQKKKIVPAFRVGRAMVFTDEEVIRYRDDPERFGRPKESSAANRPGKGGRPPKGE